MLWMGVIFGLSSLPGPEVPLPDFFFSDKLAHVLAYGLLGALIALRAGFGERFRGQRPQAWTALDWPGPLVGLLFGISDEFHQLFVPGRECSFGDWTADAVGVAVGIWLARRGDAMRPAQRI